MRPLEFDLVILQFDISFLGELGLASSPEESSAHGQGCFLCRLLPLQLPHHQVQLVPPLIAAHDGHSFVILLGLQVVFCMRHPLGFCQAQ